MEMKGRDERAYDFIIACDTELDPADGALRDVHGGGSSRVVVRHFSFCGRNRSNAMMSSICLQ
jgi:hypothetical protein